MNIILLSLLLLITNAMAEESRITYDDLVNKTVGIFRTCFFSHRRDTLLLAGAFDEFLHISEPPLALITESDRTAFDLYIMTKYSFFLYTQHSFTRLVQKVEYFTVIAISQPSLRLLFQKIKDSTWSNSDGFYILIDRHTERRGCVNAVSYLNAAWEYDLQFAVFLCIDPEEGLMLYTYNPYSEKSPKVWKEAQRLPGRRGHPWILLKRKYVPGKEMCKDLNFEKTAFVDGYEIRVNGVSVEPLLTIDLTREGNFKFTGDNGEVIKIISSKLNASLYVVVYNGTSYDLGGIGENGTIIGMLADIDSGAIDMGMNTRPLYNMWKFRYTYPHAEGGLCAITQPSGYVSEFQKVLGFISLNATFGVAAILTVVFLVLSVHQGPIPAGLNMIRLITSVAMDKLPTRNSSRIVATMGILLFIIISAVFQGHWSALLTVRVSYPNINSMDDLRKSGFDIYGPKILTDFLGDAELHKRYHGVSYQDCKQSVLDSKTAACLGDCLHLYQRIRNTRLHHSKKMGPLVQVYVTRQNWPLFTRVNRLIQRMVQAGLVTMWKRQGARQIFRERRMRRLRNKQGFKILELRELAFNFYILFTGYIFGILVFLMEIAIAKYRKKHKRKREVQVFKLIKSF